MRIFSDQSVCRNQVSGQQFDQRGFSRSVGTDEGDARVQIQTEIEILRSKEIHTEKVQNTQRAQRAGREKAYVKDLLGRSLVLERDVLNHEDWWRDVVAVGKVKGHSLILIHFFSQTAVDLGDEETLKCTCSDIGPNSVASWTATPSD